MLRRNLGGRVLEIIKFGQGGGGSFVDPSGTDVERDFQVFKNQF